MNLKTQKIWVRRRLQFAKDVFSGQYFRFAKKDGIASEFGFDLQLTQEIKPSPTLENKIHNITLAASRINQYLIGPGEILSFWRIVGNPDASMKESRTIVNGKVTSESGGGICQVSGIIYHISIMAGLEILERHNHSVDLYTDETRFTPLGTDATVVFGYKDLRLKNNFSFPVKFNLEVSSNQLSVRLLSVEPIDVIQLVYDVSETEYSMNATVKDVNRKAISHSVYKKQAES